LRTVTEIEHLGFNFTSTILYIQRLNFYLFPTSDSEHLNIFQNIPIVEFKRVFLVRANPLSDNVEYTPHGGDVTCSRCGALNRQNH